MVHVPGGLVDEIAATLLGDLMEVPLVALGGGRVIDTAKAIGGVTGLQVAAIPTTLSGAEQARPSTARPRESRARTWCVPPSWWRTRF